MELTPQSVRSTEFKTIRKGYDPAEVDVFKIQVASAIESAQNQATAMEARARAAVAKLQELSQNAPKETSPTPAAGTPAAAESAASPATSEATSTELPASDAEAISRTLHLAQRTADTTIADAQQHAAAIVAAAGAEATKIVDDSRVEGRKVNEDERLKAEGEVQALIARRDFLVSDVDHLEQHIVAQRERLRDTASALQDMVERVPAGLADVRRPLLSASGTASNDAPAGAPAGPSDSVHQVLDADQAT